MARNILITGGTDGIGYELVKRLVMRHKIMVVGRTPSEEFERLLELSENLIFVKADLSNWHFVTGSKQELYTQGLKRNLLGFRT